MTKRIPTTLLALAVLLGGLFVVSNGKSGQALSAPTPGVSLKKHIPALSRAARPADALPFDAQRMLASRPGVDDAAIRSFATKSGAGYLIPQDDGLCIAIPDPVDGYGEACSPVASARKEGVAVMMFDSAHFDAPTIALALPAGANAYVVAKSGGRTRLVPGADGVISGTLPAGSAEVLVDGPSGESTLPLPTAPPPSRPTQGVGVVRSPGQ